MCSSQSYRGLLVFQELHENDEGDTWYRVCGRKWVYGESEIQFIDRLFHGADNELDRPGVVADIEMISEGNEIVWMSSWGQPVVNEPADRLLTSVESRCAADGNVSLDRRFNRISRLPAPEPVAEVSDTEGMRP